MYGSRVLSVKLGVEEWLVLAVMSMYTGAKTVVRTVYDNSNGFEVKVGSKSRLVLPEWFCFLVLAYPGCPGKNAVK